MPRVLELFTHPGCLSREEGRHLIQAVLKDFRDVSFKDVDMAAEQKRSVVLGVRMSPTLVFDDKIIAIGIPPRETLRMLLEELTHDKTH